MSETKNTKFQIRLPIILALAISAGIWIGATFAEPKGNQNDLRAALYKLQEIMTYVDRDYVDSVNSGELIEYGITKMLEHLDPHSSYIPARDASIVQSQLDGEFDGIGVEFGIIRDTIYVVAPLTGGPSEALGIQSGDQIINVDGENMAGVGVTNRDVFEKLRGPKGSVVVVDMKRKNEKELIQYKITRNKIPQYSIIASYMVDNEIGYMKITRFAATTYNEFKESIADLQSKGMKKLVIDLQGNLGGYMGAAINMADELLGDRALIVSQKGKVDQYSDQAYAFRQGMFEEGPVIILVNENSASAAEILAGAIQDNDRGLLVGRRSFGKGLVQMPIDLNDGAELRLTIARYYTPSGRSIQKPYGADYEAYERDWVERYKHGEFFSADSIKFNDSLKYETVKGRTVFGGGGITPDYFVPMDTTMSSAYVSRLFNSDTPREFVLDFVNENKSKFENMTADQYYADYKVSDAMLDDLVEYGKKNKVEFDSKDFNKSKEYLRILVKAHLGRQIYDDSAFYKVVNDINEIYLQAIKLFDEAEKIAMATDLHTEEEE